MNDAAVRPTDAATIPVVDIAPLRDGTDPEGVARALHAANTGLGFIYVGDHGIPEAVVEAARRRALAFFARPEGEKRAVAVSRHHRGRIGGGAARMSDDAPPDLKESFVWGLEGLGTPEGDHPLRGPNRWPDEALRAAAMDYLAHAHEVAHHLMRGFAIGMGLAPDHFLRTAEAPLSRASFVWYPPQPADAARPRLGVGAHTDFGVLTVLCQDDVGGLQVRDRDGAWIEAPPVAGTLVVNVGDLLSRWTGGALHPTPHRVINASGRERLSLVLAFDPDPGTVIDPADVPSAGPDGQPPITCGDHLTRRFARAVAHRAG